MAAIIIRGRSVPAVPPARARTPTTRPAVVGPSPGHIGLGLFLATGPYQTCTDGRRRLASIGSPGGVAALDPFASDPELQVLCTCRLMSAVHLINTLAIDWGLLAAGAVVTVASVLIFFGLIGRRFVAGLS